MDIKTLVSGLFLLAIFSSCSHTDKPASATRPATKTVAKQKVISKIKWFKISNDELGGTADPHTFVDCQLYTKADTASAVIARVPAMTPLLALGRYEREVQDSIPGTNGQVATGLNSRLFVFYKVRLPNKTEGYILEDDIARFVITDKEKNVQYYLGHYIDKKEDAFRFRISKFDLGSKRLLSHLELEDLVSAEFTIFYQKGSYLKDVDRAVTIIGDNEYCGGNSTNITVADNGRKLVALPINYNFLDDGGGVYTKTTYLPDIDTLGRSVLKPGGFEAPRAGTATFKYPGNLAVPDGELIVQTLLEGAYFRDENNEDVKLKNGEYKMDVPLMLTTRYYRWDGTSLTLLPKKTKEHVNSNYPN